MKCNYCEKVTSNFLQPKTVSQKTKGLKIYYCPEHETDAIDEQGGILAIYESREQKTIDKINQKYPDLVVELGKSKYNGKNNGFILEHINNVNNGLPENAPIINMVTFKNEIVNIEEFGNLPPDRRQHWLDVFATNGMINMGNYDNQGGNFDSDFPAGTVTRLNWDPRKPEKKSIAQNHGKNKYLSEDIERVRSL